MKISSILTSVLREPWMILPEAADSYLPIISQWMNGTAVQFDEKGPLSVKMAHLGRIEQVIPQMGFATKVNMDSANDVPDFPMGTVAIVNLKGELTKYDSMCNYGASSIANLVKYLGDCKNISGLVLDVDGPGGAVNAIAVMIEAIQYVQANGKPVVVHGDLVASAHLYVAVYADHFMLDNIIGSRAGSIGTLIQFADYSKKLEDKGIKLRTIYAPQSTHKNIEFEQAKEGNDEPMKNNVLAPLAQNFMDAVRTQRAGKLNEEVDGILNGAMFFGGDAVKYGLADSIGTLNDAIQRTLDLVEVRKYMSFSY